MRKTLKKCCCFASLMELCVRASVEGRRAHHLVTLSSLFNKGTQPTIKANKPSVSYGQALQAKKEEDFVIVKTNCQRIPGDGSSTYDAFAVLDGHNGSAAGAFTKENLLNNVVNAVPSGLSRDEWLAALPRAMVAGFVKTDKDWRSKGIFSGTTVTLVIVDGYIVTCACVGDSRCVLDAQGIVTALTIDHRFDTNEEECERVVASGGQVARLHPYGCDIGPLRSWPGGICLSRTIGDVDAGEHIVPVPHVKQIKLSPGGGRLIIASDGVWDALTSEKAAKVCRGEKHPEVAAKNIVKEVIKVQGLRDDTTCLVVDIVPPGRASRSFAPAVRKQMMVMRFLRRTRSKKGSGSGAPMEELFEESSATLSERLRPVT
ncbi:probable protein phosphatase 2C 5 isoform X1 [Physcomitrium patens]|nr:probable protein phosphatase 2C 5 isoform X1 [Physcomitrium patens]AAO38849.1 calmodulin-binding protein phosphatase [Physcomitrium patens]|eukprot:XP_024393344.1 probable protein phosphatase 2C 5 isoform X1 [Physcomitrella patens]